MNDSLPEVAAVLDLVLNQDEPNHVALRRQMPRLRVRSRCECGCGTAYFDLDGSGSRAQLGYLIARSGILDDRTADPAD
jgi:hypothetical protein